MNLEERKNNSHYVHLVDLDAENPDEMLCGANVFATYDYRTNLRGPKKVYRSRNTDPINELDPRCKKCDKISGGHFRAVTPEALDVTKRGLEAMLAMDKPELQGLGPVQYALAVWLLDNGAAEPQRGYGHISAAELAEKLYDSGWIRDT